MKKILIIVGIIVGLLLVAGLSFFIYLKVAFLSKDEVKEIVLKDTGKSSAEIYFEKVDLEIEDKQYEVEIYYNNTEYEYKIDAQNGRIVYNNFPPAANNTISNEEQNTTSTNNNSQNIVAEKTLEEAKTIALNHAGLVASSVTFTKAEIDTDDGISVYDIEFTANNYEYDYEIARQTGEILKYSKEKMGQR